jgi:hypothetical protein
VEPKAGPDELEKRKFLTLPGLELRPLRRPARRITKVEEETDILTVRCYAEGIQGLIRVGIIGRTWFDT